MKKYFVTYPDCKREVTISADFVVSDSLTSYHIHFQIGNTAIAIITEPCTVIEIQ